MTESAERSLYDELEKPTVDRRIRMLPRLLGDAVRIVYRSGGATFKFALVLQVLASASVLVQLLIVRSLLTRLIADGSHVQVRDIVPELVVLVVCLGITAASAVARNALQELLADLVSRATLHRVLARAGEVDLLEYETSQLHDRLQRALFNGTFRPLQMTGGLLAVLSGVGGSVGIGIALFAISPIFFAARDRGVGAGLADRRGLQPGDVPLRLCPDPPRSRAALPAGAAERAARGQGGARLRPERVPAAAVAGQLRPAHRRAALGRAAPDPQRHAGLAAVGGAAGRRDRGARRARPIRPHVAGRRRRGAGRVDRAGRAAADAGQRDRRGVRELAVRAGLHPVRGRSGTVAAQSSFAGSGAGGQAVAGGARPAGSTSSYPAGVGPALRGVDVEVAAGEIIALVGENGSGKSTLTKLLAGLYPPQSGALTWNGVDYADLDIGTVRDQIAVLFQDYIHFDLTLAANVHFGRWRRPPDERTLALAAGAAGAGSIVAGLPEGWATRMGPQYQGGRELSGGQWQRLAIARALFRDAPLVILDEPTAALDPRAEAALFGDVRTLFAGRAVVLVSHRFGSVRSADRIYVLHEGQVVEVGTHDELVARGGRYAEMFRLQRDVPARRLSAVRPARLDEWRVTAPSGAIYRATRQRTAPPLEPGLGRCRHAICGEYRRICG